MGVVENDKKKFCFYKAKSFMWFSLINSVFVTQLCLLGLLI